MTFKTLQTILITGCAFASLSFSALAGGFDRGGVNIDGLFDKDQISTQATIRYINVSRERKNLSRGTINAGFFDAATADNQKADNSYLNMNSSAKIGIGEHVDCLGTIGQPIGAYEDNGSNTAYSPTSNKLEIKTTDYGLTCSFKHDLGKGQARLIAGGSLLDFEGTQERQSYLYATAALQGAYAGLDPNGVANIEFSDTTSSWRIGAAYEIPEIAFRAMVLYNSKYDLDLSGEIDTTNYGTTTSGVYDITASTQIPQSLELKVQSGINQKTIAFGHIKWQDWSELQSIVISPFTSATPTTANPTSTVALEPFFQDGLTITAGLGRKLTDNFSLASSLTWDRATSTTTGTQTASWRLNTGIKTTISENLEFTLGGAVGYFESGKSEQNANAIDRGSNISYDFDGEWFQAVSTSLKLKF